MLRKAALSGFPPSPVLAIGTRSVWASCCSVYTGGLQVIPIAGNQLQRCSTSGRRRMGPEKALCAHAPTPHTLPPRERPSKVRSQKRHKTSFWQLLSRKRNSPRETKLSPNASLLRKVALSGFSPSQLLAIEKGGSGLLPALCALVLCRSSLELETNSKRALHQGEC